MDFSVVIPTKNRLKELRRAIRSVTAQTLKPREIIVVDDASARSLFSVVLPAGDIPLKIVRLDHSSGPAIARNHGVSSASSQTIAFLDSDDAWLPWCLEEHARTYDSTSVDATSATAISIREGRPIGRTSWPENEPMLNAMARKTFIHTMSCFTVKKDVYNRLGGLRDGLHPCEDLDLYIRLLRTGGRIAPVIYPLVHRSVGNWNLTGNLVHWAKMYERLLKLQLTERFLGTPVRDLSHGIIRRILERGIEPQLTLRERTKIFLCALRCLPVYLRVGGFLTIPTGIFHRPKNMLHATDAQMKWWAHSSRNVIVSLSSGMVDLTSTPFACRVAEEIGRFLSEHQANPVFLPLSISLSDDDRLPLTIASLAAKSRFCLLMSVPDWGQIEKLVSSATAVITSQEKLAQLAKRKGIPCLRLPCCSDKKIPQATLQIDGIQKRSIVHTDFLKGLDSLASTVFGEKHPSHTLSMWQDIGTQGLPDD